jgi:hypothetical protein
MLETSQPKPRPHKRVQASNRRTEAKIKRQVRAACVERDRACRLGSRLWHDDFDAEMWVSPCSMDSEWAHMAGHRRFETRGLPPEQRHGTAWTLQLCRAHHEAYDGRTTGKRLAITALSERGADGPLRFERVS